MVDDEQPPADTPVEEKPADDTPPPNPELDEAKAKIAALERAAQDAAPLIDAGRTAKRGAFLERMGRGNVPADLQPAFDAALAATAASLAIDVATANEDDLTRLAQAMIPIVGPMIRRRTAAPPVSMGSDYQHPYSRIPRDF